MEISSILSSSTDVASTLEKEKKSTSSFESYFMGASDSSQNSDSSGNTVSKDPGGDAALQEFMKYAKETPQQRMFDSWLKSQNISEQQYNAMSPAEKQKLMDQFENQMKAKLKSEMTSTASL